MWGFFFRVFIALTGSFVPCYSQQVNNGSTATGQEWDYQKARGDLDTNHWYLKYEHCNGTRQSPVSIDCAHVVTQNKSEPLSFVNYNKAVQGLVMRNDGHTIKIEVPQDAGVIVRSQSLPADYRLTQLHFHWGTTKFGGSEHRINGKRWPLEMHLVHVDQNIPANRTLIDKNGMVVVSVLFDLKVDGDDSKRIDGIEALAEALSSVVHEGQNITLEPFALQKLVPRDAATNYLRYSGSLTTPPCAEVVEWFIVTRTMAVTQHFLTQIRSTRQRIHSLGNSTAEEPKIVENDRPLQPLSDRPVRLFGNMTDLTNCAVPQQVNQVVEWFVDLFSPITGGR